MLSSLLALAATVQSLNGVSRSAAKQAVPTFFKWLADCRLRIPPYVHNLCVHVYRSQAESLNGLIYYYIFVFFIVQLYETPYNLTVKGLGLREYQIPFQPNILEGLKFFYSKKLLDNVSKQCNFTLHGNILAIM